MRRELVRFRPKPGNPHLVANFWVSDLGNQGALIGNIYHIKMFAPDEPFREKIVVIDLIELEHPVSPNLLHAGPNA